MKPSYVSLHLLQCLFKNILYILYKLKYLNMIKKKKLSDPQVIFKIFIWSLVKSYSEDRWCLDNIVSRHRRQVYFSLDDEIV